MKKNYLGYFLATITISLGIVGCSASDNSETMTKIHEASTAEEFSLITEEYHDVIDTKFDDGTLRITLEKDDLNDANHNVEFFAFESIKLLEELSNNENVDVFVFTQPGTLLDKKLNEFEYHIISVAYTKDNLKEINMENFYERTMVYPEFFYDMADAYWIVDPVYYNLDEEMQSKVNAWKLSDHELIVGNEMYTSLIEAEFEK